MAQRRQPHGAVVVAVHVRRGDLAVNNASKVPGHYYKRAVECMGAKFPNRNLTFILMGGGRDNRRRDVEDYQWVRRHVSKVPFEEIPLTHRPALDMAIMANSDAVIMSSGSFGFWGTYLNYKTCIAPDCPLSEGYDQVNDDYYPPWCQRLHC